MTKIIKLMGSDGIPIIFGWPDEQGEMPEGAEVLSEDPSDVEKLAEGTFLSYGEDFVDGQRVVDLRMKADNEVPYDHKPTIYMLKYAEAITYKQTGGLPSSSALYQEAELHQLDLEELVNEVIAKNESLIAAEITRQRAQVVPPEESE